MNITGGLREPANLSSGSLIYYTEIMIDHRRTLLMAIKWRFYGDQLNGVKESG